MFKIKDQDSPGEKKRIIQAVRQRLEILPFKDQTL